MLPPKDVAPSALFRKLLEPLPTEVVDYPRYDDQGNPFGRVRIRVLTLDDHNRARLEAERQVQTGRSREDLTNPAMREVISDLSACETLAMACLTEEAYGTDQNGQPLYGRIFASAKDLKQLPAGEIAVLFSAYQLVQAKYGPYEHTIENDQDVSAWVARLVEGASELPLLRLQLPDCLGLTLLLAQRVYTLYSLLAGQRSSLPSTLAAALESFCTDTGCFGEDAASSSSVQATGGASRSELVTIEQAIRFAQELKNQPPVGQGNE